MTWLIGVDVGGTFTDFFAYDTASAEVRLYKRSSTPDNPAAAIADGLLDLCREFAIDIKNVSRVCHGTTVATNALIQRGGGKVAVITTRGFRDLLEIGRQTRPHLYSFQIDHPEPLVPRQRRFEVKERLTDGPRLIEPLDEASMRQAIAAVIESGAEACAVCLLFSHLDGSHERRIGAALKEAKGDLYVSLSSEVQPEFREYERFSTAVLNAYLQPVMDRYLSFLERRLAQEAPLARVGIYQSSGGLMSIETSRRIPVRTALSGPAAGAIGAIYSARQSQQPDIITLDMGGTSADVALMRNYEAGIRFDRDVAGFPVRLPMVDIHTIGAGGGSTAWFDRDGLLKVGPSSAGADPGPACYGRGGKEATVTDANLLLGRLSPRGLIGGRMPLDRDAAREAVKPIAERLGFSIERTARGIIDIVVANMVRAIRTISIERGHDPRKYCLLPFGGAGPLHGSEVARQFAIRRILVPAAPGILCAQGLIASDLKDDFVRSARVSVDRQGLSVLESTLAALVVEARAWFAAENVKMTDQQMKLSFDMRFVGQNFELPVTVAHATGGAAPCLVDEATLKSRFRVVHEQYYGFYSETDPVEVVNVRLMASAPIARLESGGKARKGSRPAEVFEHRDVWFDAAKPCKTPVFDRSRLESGHRIDGPAIIEQFDSTAVLYPGDALTVDDALNLIIEVGE